MALIDTLDTTSVGPRLTAWVTARLGGAENVRVTGISSSTESGMSMSTVGFDVAYEENGDTHRLELIARIAPPPPRVFDDTDLRREFRLLTILRNCGVPVPRVRWLGEELEVFGGEFLVMDRAAGAVAPDDPPFTVAGWVLELAPARRAILHDAAIDVLGGLRAVDWRAAGLDDVVGKPEFGEPGIEQQLGRWDAFYRWAAGEHRRSPTVEAALTWLDENRPSTERLALCWGDPRVGNIVYDQEDLSVRAVLDWELATIADPEFDLGWLLFFLRFYTEGIGAPRPEGVQDRDQLVSAWEEACGLRAEHPHYYEVFAAARMSIIMVRAGVLMIEAGKVPPDSLMAVNNPPAQLLARMLDLPQPAGESDYFVDKR